MTIAILRNKTWILLIASTFLFASCDSKAVFDQYIAMENTVWNQEEPAVFEFQIADTIQNNHLYINIRNNEDYGYSNLFLITQLNFPDGKKVVDTLEYEMTDFKGRFLGDGLSETKESKLFYKENWRFPISGNYTVNIQQAMRKNGTVEGIQSLEGIIDVGFRIEKVE